MKTLGCVPKLKKSFEAKFGYARVESHEKKNPKLNSKKLGSKTGNFGKHFRKAFQIDLKDVLNAKIDDFRNMSIFRSSNTGHVFLNG